MTLDVWRQRAVQAQQRKRPLFCLFGAHRRWWRQRQEEICGLLLICKMLACIRCFWFLALFLRQPHLLGFDSPWVFFVCVCLSNNQSGNLAMQKWRAIWCDNLDDYYPVYVYCMGVAIRFMFVEDDEICTYGVLACFTSEQFLLSTRFCCLLMMSMMRVCVLSTGYETFHEYEYMQQTQGVLTHTLLLLQCTHMLCFIVVTSHFSGTAITKNQRIRERERVRGNSKYCMMQQWQMANHVANNKLHAIINKREQQQLGSLARKRKGRANINAKNWILRSCMPCIHICIDDAVGILSHQLLRI